MDEIVLKIADCVYRNDLNSGKDGYKKHSPYYYYCMCRGLMWVINVFMILSLKVCKWLILTDRLNGINEDLTLTVANISLIMTICSIILNESLILVPIMFKWDKIYDEYKKSKLEKNN